jgi:hypothetical protein
MTKSSKGDSEKPNPFRSEVTQTRILQHLRKVNVPETIREIAVALDMEPSEVAGNLGALMSVAEQGGEGVRRVMGEGETTRYEIVLAQRAEAGP